MVIILSLVGGRLDVLDLLASLIHHPKRCLPVPSLAGASTARLLPLPRRGKGFCSGPDGCEDTGEDSDDTFNGH